MKLAETPGERLERAIYAAAALAGVKGNESSLERELGLSRKVLRRLFAGGAPDGDTLRKIAAALETTTPEALLAAREGRSPDVGLDRIATEIQRLREALVPETKDDGLSEAGAGAAIAARADPMGGPEGDPPSEPAASFRRRRSDGETPPQSQP